MLRSKAVRLRGVDNLEIVLLCCDISMKFLADKVAVGGFGLAVARKSKRR